MYLYVVPRLDTYLLQIVTVLYILLFQIMFLTTERLPGSQGFNPGMGIEMELGKGIIN